MPPTRIGSLAVLLTTAALAGCGDDDKDTAATPPPPAASTPASTTDGTAATGGEIAVNATDFKFTPSAITADAGDLEITLTNEGQAPHELVLLKTDAAADALPVSNGKVEEQGEQGEIEEIASGASDSHTFDVSPGRYVYVCNVPGHYADGMHGTLTVK